MDIYATLEVGSDASAAEIKRSYLSLARRWHPDKNAQPEATSRFAQISRAFEVLSNEEKRRKWDRLRRKAARGGASAAGQPSPKFDFAEKRKFPPRGESKRRRTPSSRRTSVSLSLSLSRHTLRGTHALYDTRTHSPRLCSLRSRARASFVISLLASTAPTIDTQRRSSSAARSEVRRACAWRSGSCPPWRPTARGARRACAACRTCRSPTAPPWPEHQRTARRGSRLRILRQVFESGWRLVSGVRTI